MSSSLSNKVQKVLDESTSAEDGPVGMVFGAIDKSGNVLVKAASGESKKGSGEQMETDS